MNRRGEDPSPFDKGNMYGDSMRGAAHLPSREGEVRESFNG